MADSLARILVQTLHHVRRLQDEKREISEALHAALDVVAERDRELNQSRANNLHLRAEIRAYASGRTIAEERQALEDEEVGGSLRLGRDEDKAA